MRVTLLPNPQTTSLGRSAELSTVASRRADRLRQLREQVSRGAYRIPTDVLVLRVLGSRDLGNFG